MHVDVLKSRFMNIVIRISQISEKITMEQANILSNVSNIHRTAKNCLIIMQIKQLISINLHQKVIMGVHNLYAIA